MQLCRKLYRAVYSEFLSDYTVFLIQILFERIITIIHLTLHVKCLGIILESVT